MSEFTNSLLLMGRLRRGLKELSPVDRQLAEVLIRETASKLKESPHYWRNYALFFHPTAQES